MDTSGPGEKQHEPPASSHAQASPSPQMTLPTHFVVPSTTGGGRDRRVDASLHPRVLVTPSHQGSIPATSTSSGQVGGGATAHCKVSGVQWSDTYSPYKREEGDYSSTSEILIKAVPPSATTTTPSSLLQPSTSSPYTSIISSSSSYPHPTATKYISDSTEEYRLVSSSYYPSYTYSSTPGLRVVEEESSASQTTRPNAKTISSSNTLVPPPPSSSSSSSPLLSSPSPLPHKTISTSVYTTSTPPASTIPAAVAYTPSTLTPPPAVSRTYVVEESSPTVYYTQQILTDEKPVLPLREVCRYTEACTLPDPSPYYEEHVEGYRLQLVMGFPCSARYLLFVLFCFSSLLLLSFHLQLSSVFG
ncbi:hypothetical protein CSUI_003142 [Cystoisospora suis]|uniref:Uncharacterized protein n=1 Tax=Cystoisospora suis TaxID=483139 RepID=A0A2C6L3T4_9APIC|nr:hypothetical protein CSUI_003142 [Cystoisospora suis]